MYDFLLKPEFWGTFIGIIIAIVGGIGSIIVKRLGENNKKVVDLASFNTQALSKLQESFNLISEDNLQAARTNHELYKLIRTMREQALSQAAQLDEQINTLQNENEELKRENRELKALVYELKQDVAKLQALVESKEDKIKIVKDEA